jgi:hypothetical protein
MTLAVAALPVHAAGPSGTLPPAAVVVVAKGEPVNGSGRIVEDRREIAGFVAVRVTGPVDVQLKSSERDAVVVRADDNVAPLITTRLTDGERPALEIGVMPDASFRAWRGSIVIVEFRALSEIVVRGSGDVRADRIAADDFALSMIGSGDTRIDSLRAQRFAAALSGSGDLFIAGKAEEQAFRLGGSGDVHAGGLEGRRVQIAIAGSGEARVRASDTLDVSISGSGDVVYDGSPRVTQRIRGSGAVRRAR